MLEENQFEGNWIQISYFYETHRSLFMDTLTQAQTVLGKGEESVWW